MKVKLLDSKTSEIDLPDSFINTPYKESLIHQVLVASMNGLRSGTRAQKNRSQVRGGGAKPWRQKGTGRARSGTNSSPIWVGGGRAFPARNRDFSQKVNKKMYATAIKSVFSELIRQNRLKVVKDFKIAEPKTKLFLATVNKLQIKNALVILDSFEDNVFLSARNLYSYGVCDSDNINIASLIGYQNILITKVALEKIIIRHNGEIGL